MRVVISGSRREPPPHLYFVVSAVFHYLGPSFAVLLFARVAVLGVAFAAANAVLFAAYIVLAHRVAQRADVGGIDGLAAAMLVAAVVVCPLGGWKAAPAFLDPVVLLAGIGVGISSSVIPYVSDQLAMRRLPRANYALMGSLLTGHAAYSRVIVL